jgi:pyridoxamine 5'-phosphate oxidase
MTSSSLLSEPTTQHERQPWASNLVTLHAFVWEELAKGLQDRHSVNRFPTLVTVSHDGRPQARTVVLRGANRDEWQLEIYTESDSAKAAELRASPRAAIHVWNTETRLQVRMEAYATLIQGDEARKVWDSLPLASQLTCGKTPPTGSAIKNSLAYEIQVDPDKFMVVRLAIDLMDVLHLGDMHRRAQFQRNTREFGQWCVP